MKAGGIITASDQDILGRILASFTADRAEDASPRRGQRGAPAAGRDANSRIGARSEPHARLAEAELVAAERAHAAGADALRERIRDLGVAIRAVHYQAHWAAEWSHELDAVRDLACDLANAARGLAALRERLLRAPRGAGVRRQRIASAAVRLPGVIQAFETALADYHRLELALAHDAMRARRAECELEARKYRELAEQVRDLRARLYGHWWEVGRWVMRGKALRRERARVGSRLHDLSRRRQRRQVFIEAHEIRHWLDRLVTASRYLPPREWLAETRESRAIFYQLLNVHCLQARLPAERLAVNVLLRPDAHAALSHCKAAQRYLERYLERQRCPGSLDEDTCRRVRETLLGEYRERSSGERRGPLGQQQWQSQIGVDWPA